MGAADGAIFTRHRVKVGGFEISYLQGGHDGAIAPTLSLHGMGGAGKWEAYHMALGTITHTCVPQLPGWPEGRLPAGIASVGDYTALVLEFLDAVGIDQVILFGHSLGGWIALQVATMYPERISRLILVDAMGLDLPSAPAVDLHTLDEESFAKAVFGRSGIDCHCTGLWFRRRMGERPSGAGVRAAVERARVGDQLGARSMR